LKFIFRSFSVAAVVKLRNELCSSAFFHDNSAISAILFVQRKSETDKPLTFWDNSDFVLIKNFDVCDFWILEWFHVEKDRNFEPSSKKNLDGGRFGMSMYFLVDTNMIFSVFHSGHDFSCLSMIIKWQGWNSPFALLLWELLSTTIAFEKCKYSGESFW